jgi:hypothetical protein
MPARASAASDSEPERVSPKKASSKQRATASDEDPEGMQVDEGEEEEDEQEYEIEAILEAKENAFADVRAYSHVSHRSDASLRAGWGIWSSGRGSRRRIIAG